MTQTLGTGCDSEILHRIKSNTLLLLAAAAVAGRTAVAAARVGTVAPLLVNNLAAGYQQNQRSPLALAPLTQ